MNDNEKLALFNLLLIVLACVFVAGYYLGLSHSTVTHVIQHKWVSYIEMLPNVETYKPENPISLDFNEWLEKAPKQDL